MTPTNEELLRLARKAFPGEDFEVRTDGQVLVVLPIVYWLDDRKLRNRHECEPEFTPPTPPLRSCTCARRYGISGDGFCLDCGGDV